MKKKRGIETLSNPFLKRKEKRERENTL